MQSGVDYYKPERWYNMSRLLIPRPASQASLAMSLGSGLLLSQMLQDLIGKQGDHLILRAHERFWLKLRDKTVFLYSLNQSKR
jgi:hypothetical protein